MLPSHPLPDQIRAAALSHSGCRPLAAIVAAILDQHRPENAGDEWGRQICSLCVSTDDDGAISQNYPCSPVRIVAAALDVVIVEDCGESVLCSCPANAGSCDHAYPRGCSDESHGCRHFPDIPTGGQ